MEIHYSPKNIDDKFSKDLYQVPRRCGRRKECISAARYLRPCVGKYETKIDDEILGKSTIQFVPAVSDSIKRGSQRRN